MEEAVVVKKGLLYLLQHQTFGKKWRKFWGVLYRECAFAAACLELLDGSQPPSTEKAKKGDSTRRLIKLDNCVHVAEASQGTSSPKETVPFILETTEKCYFLAAERAEAADWILELCEQAFVRSTEDCRVMFEKDLLKGTSPVLSMVENSLYSPTCKAAEKSFPVAVRATEASERCRLWGRFLLCATADALELCGLEKVDVVCAWPYKFLRRFGHDKVIFSFEAGRRCTSGEGSFEFATKQGNEIIQAIEAAINAQRNSCQGGSPNALSSATLPARATSQAMSDEGARGGEDMAPDEGQSFQAPGTTFLSVGRSWRGKPVEGKRVKPTVSCPLSNTKHLFMKLSDPHPRHGSQCGPWGLEPAGRVPQVARGLESAYADPFDTISKSLGGTDGGNFPLPSTEGAPAPSALRCRTGGLGLVPASTELEHIYDDLEDLVHLVYDEPQEFKGEAWKLQATVKDPVGHEYPYDPSLDDYSVPKVAVYAPERLHRQHKNVLGETRK
ncbi:docking protein 2 [Rhineura floridana]|uniref:docking protein 2 n=1 Tax=Rhineura floridana TaxID=261503 RepID=UPI002AC7F1AC|nr:docking protein 2 [Rhineura floridana]